MRIVFCALGLSGHKKAWAAATLCFFAAFMVIALFGDSCTGKSTIAAALVQIARLFWKT